MKKIILLLGTVVLFTAECWAEQNTSVILMLDDSEMLMVGYTEQQNDETTRGKKDKQTIATIFAGLAGSCAHVGEIVAAQTDREKKQGILSLIGTVFSVAAELVGSSHRVRPNNSAKVNEGIRMDATEGAAAITLRFFDVLALEKDPLSFIEDDAMLTKIYQLDNDEEKVLMIQSCMEKESSAIAYWTNLGAILEDYIASYVASAFDLFNHVQSELAMPNQEALDAVQTEISSDGEILDASPTEISPNHSTESINS